MIRRMLAVAAIAAAAIPAVAVGQECDFMPHPKTYAARDTLRRTLREAWGPEVLGERVITARVSAPPEQVTTALLTLLSRCALPVTTSNAGVIAMQFQRRAGMMGKYDLSAHALVAATDTGTVVRMWALETAHRGPLLDVVLADANVTGNSGGRAGAVWTSLRLIADRLPTEATQETVTTAVHDPKPFVGSATSKVFMARSCELAKSIVPLDLVVFTSEAEAKAAGYARSGAPGC